jgi:hypothetical protein
MGKSFGQFATASMQMGAGSQVMSYTNVGKLSDDDIQALIAYIRSQPAAGQETVNPPDELNLLGVIMLGAGMLPGGKPIFTGVITAPSKGPIV